MMRKITPSYARTCLGVMGAASIGLICFSVKPSWSSVPRAPMHVTDDTAIYQSLSEIKIARERDLNFDADISRLSQMENRYQERLPALSKNKRIAGPLSRIALRKYQYTGSTQRAGMARIAPPTAPLAQY